MRVEIVGDPVFNQNIDTLVNDGQFNLHLTRGLAEVQAMHAAGRAAQTDLAP